MREQRDIGAVAEGQWGVLTLAQLHEAGYGANQITRRCRDGILHRLHPAVYAYGLRRLPARGVLLAAQFACGEGAYISGRTALGLQKVRGLYLGAIEVVVPGRRVRPPGPPVSVRTTRTAPPADELRRDGPLLYAGVPRALLDAALTASQRELERLGTEAIHTGRLHHADMRRLLDDHVGHPGIGRLRAAYADYLPRPSARSGLERAFDRALAERPWIPDPQRNVYVAAAGIDWEIDRYWSDVQVGVELQGGPYHSATPDRAKDELKAAKLAGLGVQLLCVSDTRFELEPGAVFGDLEAALAARVSRSSRYP